MTQIIPNLNDISIAVNHLKLHMKLLNDVLARLPKDTKFDVTDILPLIEVRVGPTVTGEGCKIPIPNPVQPILNNCRNFRFPSVEKAEVISVPELVLLVNNAIGWCSAIHDALEEPPQQTE